MHYKDIIATYKAQYPENQIADTTIHQLLSKNKDIFTQNGDGFYGLVEWNNHPHEADPYPYLEIDPRRERLLRTLWEIEQPANTAYVTFFHNKLFPDKPLSEHETLAVLTDNQTLFSQSEPGYFSLADKIL